MTDYPDRSTDRTHYYGDGCEPQHLAPQVTVPSWSEPSTDPLDVADVERGIDGLDAEHDQAYHVHAAECCMVAGKYTRAVLAAVLPDHDRRLLLALADEIEATPSRVFVSGAPAWLRAKAEGV